MEHYRRYYLYWRQYWHQPYNLPGPNRRLFQVCIRRQEGTKLDTLSYSQISDTEVDIKSFASAGVTSAVTISSYSQSIIFLSSPLIKVPAGPQQRKVGLVLATQ